MSKEYDLDNIRRSVGSVLLKMKLDGSSFGEMFEYSKKLYPELTYDAFEYITNHIYTEIIAKSLHLSTNVINSHLLRYDEIYKFFMCYDMFANAQKALEAKEKLLGYHSDIYSFEVNNILNTDEEKKDFDINKLSEEDKTIFLQLINKARVK